MQALSFTLLSDWLKHLETAHPVNIDMGLERVCKVWQALLVEHDLVLSCPVVTVAGTNGKGSTCAMLSSICQQAGYKVGLYTSPHLIKFNERIQLNGQPVEDAVLVDLFQRIENTRSTLANVSLTYFEFTTLAALLYFTEQASQQALDVMVLEVGMGGRLDAVNIIDADCAIVTSIDLDHMAYLGDTREKIAIEKAGVFRAGKPAICSDPMLPQSLVDYAKHIGADLRVLGADFNYQGDRQQWAFAGKLRRRSGMPYPALRGVNQLLNASAALAALETLEDRLPVTQQDVKNGLAMVEWPARFQVLPGRPAVVLDVAHNPHASAVLAQNLDQMGFYPNTHAIFGLLGDKDLAGVVQPLLQLVDCWHCVTLDNARGLTAEALAASLENYLKQQGLQRKVLTYVNPLEAMKIVKEQVGEGDRIVVFGSFHTVAGVLPATM
jgi:dihydrofolate synthase / folylpolyglutamate synthase